MINDLQPELFESGEWWVDSWQGMPEFIQEDLAPFWTIQVNFRSQEDLERFSALVEQRINPKTRSIWYPEAEIGHFVNKRFIDAPL